MKVDPNDPNYQKQQLLCREKKRIKTIFKKTDEFYKLGLPIGAEAFSFIKFHNLLYVYNTDKDTKTENPPSMDTIRKWWPEANIMGPEDFPSLEEILASQNGKSNKADDGINGDLNLPDTGEYIKSDVAEQVPSEPAVVVPATPPASSPATTTVWDERRLVLDCSSPPPSSSPSGAEGAGEHGARGRTRKAIQEDHKVHKASMRPRTKHGRARISARRRS